MFKQVSAEKRLHVMREIMCKSSREFWESIEKLNRQNRKYLVDPASSTIYVLEEVFDG